MADLPPYHQRLAAALERSGLSKRQAGARLAEREGLKDGDAGRRQLYKYLDARTPAEPEPERAAVLAVMLGAPELALVQSPAERRRGRLGELEERVADLEKTLRVSLPLLDGVVAEVELLSRQSPPRRRQDAQKAG